MTTPGGHDDATDSHAESRESAADGSAAAAAVRRVGDRTATAVSNSYLYRWLTKEPEPEVIVIDLRETYTIGPIITVLDRLTAWLAPYWRESTPKRALDRVAALADRAAETRVGQLLAKLLAPPEPPASDRDGNADAHGEADSSTSAETSDEETPADR